MGCDTCVFLNDVRNHADQKGSKLEPCSMEYGCNPFFKEGVNSSILISESFCGTCLALQKDCQCAEGVRQIRNRKVQVAKKRY
jgi:hypothetical protein